MQLQSQRRENRDIKNDDVKLVAFRLKELSLQVLSTPPITIGISDMILRR